MYVDLHNKNEIPGLGNATPVSGETKTGIERIFVLTYVDLSSAISLESSR